MEDNKEILDVKSAICRLFSLPEVKEPQEGDARLSYCSSASATFHSLPFSVLVTGMRDELVRMAVLNDKDTPNGDWIRGGIYCLDQLYQRYEMLNGEHLSKE